MNRTMFALAAFAFLAMPGNTTAEMIVEIDVDGQLGNGPDEILLTPSDSFLVDVWVTGTEFDCFSGFGIILLHSDNLMYLDGTVVPSDPWEVSAVVADSGSVSFSGVDPSLDGVNVNEFLLATLRFSYSGIGVGTLGIDTGQSIWGNCGFTEYFDGFVGATVRKATTAAEPMSWGEIKRFFY